MDKNKLALLREVGYEVQRVCGLCEHGTFLVRNAYPWEQWGVCELRQYQHGKHTGEPRDMSVTALGKCASFSPCPSRVATLGGFSELFCAVPDSNPRGDKMDQYINALEAVVDGARQWLTAQRGTMATASPTGLAVGRSFARLDTVLGELLRDGVDLAQATWRAIAARGSR